MRYLVIIPARGGSKGVPEKNIKLLNGKPLIHYTIEAAKSIFSDKDICVSTDSEKIKEITAEAKLKVPFLRPNYLAEDTSGTYEVLLHAVDWYEKNGQFYDAVILLQPTSPFRNTSHIEEAIKVFSLELDMVVSVKETGANPYYVLFEENKEGFLRKSKEGNFTRRQDCPPVYEYNGAIYIINVKELKGKGLSKFSKVKKFVMDEVSSIDIDTPLDWQIAEFLIAENN
jgi:N-acylneuraminate cytidylyltransferase